MTDQVSYPFDIEFLRQNKAFMLFCPPDRLDEEGRPVLEGRSVLYKLDESAFQKCPYSDSRGISDKPINVESLKSLSRHQDGVRKFIAGAAHFLGQQQSAPGVADLSRLYAISYIGYRAPSLFFCQQLFNKNESIPVVCAIVSRFFHGLINMLAVISQENNGILTGVTMTAEQLYLYADKHGQLIGREACAASKATIVNHLELCLGSLAAPIHRVESSSLPIEAIGRFSQMTMVLEFSCFIYELVRCWFWRKQLGNGEIVKQRFATPHCSLALKLTQFKRPFDHVFFHRAMNQMEALCNAQVLVMELVRLARAGVEATPYDNADRAKLHKLMKEQMQFILEQHEEVLQRYVVGGCYLSCDLDVFFGSWPD